MRLPQSIPLLCKLIVGTNMRRVQTHIKGILTENARSEKTVCVFELSVGIEYILHSVILDLLALLSTFK